LWIVSELLCLYSANEEIGMYQGLTIELSVLMESRYLSSMTIEQALSIIDTVLTPAKLTNIQELVFRQCWEGKSYSEIAEKAGYDDEYIKTIGAKVWQILSDALGEKVTKSNFLTVFRRKQIELRQKATPFIQQEIAKPLSTQVQGLSDSSSTVRQQTQAVLVHIETNERLRVALGKSVVYVGRPNERHPPDIDVSHLPSCSIVSRVHALLTIKGKSYFLEDAGSSNGTYLNGKPIDPGLPPGCQLKPGDIICLGQDNKVCFRFELEEWLITHEGEFQMNKPT
jgi:pSer/pThr/pTyr-binding forkhead associated (FHA) protein